MSEQDNYAIPPSRNTEEIQKNYNSDAKQMRAKAARARIAARQKAERDAQQRAAVEKIPLEHRYVPDQAGWDPVRIVKQRLLNCRFFKVGFVSQYFRLAIQGIRN